MPRRYPAVGIAALVRVGRIERCLEAAGIAHFQVDLMLLLPIGDDRVLGDGFGTPGFSI